MHAILTHRFFPLLLIVFLALLLRLPQLTGSFWLDEAAQALESTRPFSQQLDIVADFQPPLLHLVTHFASYFSFSEWWLRTVGALVPGLLTIVCTYALLLRVAGKRVAVVASLLLATSSLHIFFSQELRPYSLPAVFAAASWWFLYEKRWHWYTIVTIVGLYSSYLYPFLLLTQVIWQLLIRADMRKQLLISLITSALFFAPWLPMFFAQLQAGQLLRHDLPGWESVVSIPQNKALQLVFAKFIFGMSNVSISPIYLFVAGGVGLGCCALIFYLWSKLSVKKQKDLALLLCWACLPLLMSWLASWIIPVVQPKRLLLSLAGFYGLVSYLFVLAAEQKNRVISRVGYALVGTLFLLNIWSTMQYYTDTWLQRENWRGIIGKLEQSYPSQDILALFIFPDPFAPWRWYANPKITTLTTKAIYITDNYPLREILEPTLDYQYIVLFDYLQDLTDPNRLVTLELQKFGFRETGSFSADNLGFVRVFTNHRSTGDEG
ncbi:MAG: hypothetical protein A2632_00875 [Candidatus Pacebacteria bacterium RIFCSPHIGHO2_01_FULL_46_16]|nr:MAG: hypothetical protein A2632_00875 [Candidatus Pacebacteria bacterium RIFCSPHIGHO2_01_FULL_46_16]